MRILVAGFQHETNTFAPTPTDYDNFVRGEGFPALARGDEVLALAGVNIPAGGFLQAAQADGHEIVPVLWAAASPAAHVTRRAFETIATEIVEAARKATYDAIYLDLHGAMVTVDADDGEGELLARLRACVGPDMPIVVSLDLHANVTAGMLRDATAMVAYRSYPHVDMADTGANAYRLLQQVMQAGGKLHTFSLRLPFLIPINGMCTLLEPARSIYDAVASLEAEAGLASLSFTPGFPAADFPECGPVVWGHGTEPDALRTAVQALYDRVEQAEPEWAVPFLAPAEAILQAQDLARHASKPVVIADTQDNPGAGGDSNTTGMLRALIDADAQDAALGLLWDPEAVQQAIAAGVGNKVTLSLGGKSKVAGVEPLLAEFLVEYVGDGKCRFDGPMMHGVQADVGPVVCLRIGGVRVVVSSGKSQMLDRNLFRTGNVQPEAMKILVVKSSVHFRADFQPIAEAVLVAKAPGPMMADCADLPWTRLSPGIRTRPMGQAFAS
ncbi:M81 family metallopeptidase [Bordetella sp. 15P40C-2]|uniref:M81 family metallopeptidase n=1 Tax=Bordetella sp. 15P40C-2 TaxID=2572246 RepID=UPI0013259890|nr:M81 family metallopeptidase [Bordetella sp. 15P40C-2]MVW71097.1 microcystin degradation protein MlrC [Bordetella sp. 15P40C-2]